MQQQNREVTVSELVTPEMANFNGKLHGGELLSLADKSAYVCATRYSGEYSVTASFDKVDFHEPVEVGELITFLARVIGVGSSSMMIEITVTAEDMKRGTSRKCATCHVTMVAVEDGSPKKIPKLVCETDRQRRDCLRALVRKEQSEEYIQSVKEMEQWIRQLSPDQVKEELKKRGKAG